MQAYMARPRTKKRPMCLDNQLCMSTIARHYDNSDIPTTMTFLIASVALHAAFMLGSAM